MSEEEPALGVCKNCFSYKVFGKKCWYFWEHKKTCTHFRKDEYAPEEHESIE